MLTITHTTLLLVPSPPANVVSVAMSPNSIFVYWTRSTGSSPITYIVAYCNASEPEAEVKTKQIENDCCTTLDGLIPSTEYKVWVRAMNTVGCSEHSKIVQTKTEGDYELTKRAKNAAGCSEQGEIIRKKTEDDRELTKKSRVECFRIEA